MEQKKQAITIISFCNSIEIILLLSDHQKYIFVCVAELVYMCYDMKKVENHCYSVSVVYSHDYIADWEHHERVLYGILLSWENIKI